MLRGVPPSCGGAPLQLAAEIPAEPLQGALRSREFFAHRERRWDRGHPVGPIRVAKPRFFLLRIVYSHDFRLPSRRDDQQRDLDQQKDRSERQRQGDTGKHGSVRVNFVFGPQRSSEVSASKAVGVPSIVAQMEVADGNGERERMRQQHPHSASDGKRTRSQRDDAPE